MADPVSARIATLSVLELSDSFASLWPDLASDAGLSLTRVAPIDEWRETPGTIRLIAGGGVEGALVDRLSALRCGASSRLAVVGSDPGHRAAVAIMAAGASEYFALPTDLPLLRSWIRDQADHVAALSERRAFVAREESKYRFDGMIGTSPALRLALGVASRVIPRANVTVLITGETGTGKELLARAIHYNGPRRDGPFVDLNCAAIPEQLLESELFGHEKGAFTHATSSKPGLFEVASGGTIFLDEIGHLSLGLQAKLLRVLDQRTMRRVGGTTLTPVDARVVAATHVRLADAVRRGEFREDLYYRLNVLPIELPPLRVRDRDVILLTHHFIERFATEYQLPPLTLTPAAETALLEQRWNGNVRELRNVIERTTLLATGPTIDLDDLAFRPGGASESGGTLPFPATMREIALRAARATVDLCGGNKSAAARRLSISRTRLLRLLAKETNSPADEEEDE